MLNAFILNVFIQIVFMVCRGALIITLNIAQLDLVQINLTYPITG
jgi:hypothetical protein